MVGVAFHGICPTIFHPDLIATILQTYLLSLCVLLSQQSHLFPICVVHEKIFTGFAKFQGTVSVNDIRLPIRLQELLQPPLCFLRKFFVFHGYDWIHWVAKSCTTTAYRWLFRDSQLSPNHHNFQHEVRLRHCVFCTGPLILVLWQISQSRSLGKWV